MSPKSSHPLCFLISVMKCLNKTMKKCLAHIDLVCNSHSNKIYLFCIKTTSLDKLQVPDKQQKPTMITEDKSPNS